MASTSTAMGKPVFGPHVSASMFEKKWHAKFAPLKETCDKKPKLHATSDVQQYKAYFTWCVKMTSQCFPLIQYYQLEAKAVGIALPPRDTSDSGKRGEGAVRKGFVLREVVNLIMDDCADAKMGKGFTSGLLKWQHFPLQERQAMNKLLVERKEAMEAGLWEYDEGVQAMLHEDGGADYQELAG